MVTSCSCHHHPDGDTDSQDSLWLGYRGEASRTLTQGSGKGWAGREASEGPSFPIFLKGALS